MSDLLYWKSDFITRKVLSDIEDEIQKVINEFETLGVHDNDKLIREYAKRTGKLEGLRFIHKLFEIEREENDDRNNDNTSRYSSEDDQ